MLQLSFDVEVLEGGRKNTVAIANRRIRRIAGAGLEFALSVFSRAAGTLPAAALFRDCDLLDHSPPMRRTVIAAAWIAGTTIPLLAATIFVFGCCVLPFHG